MNVHQPTDQTPFVVSFGPAPSIECVGCGKVRELPHRRGFVEPADITGIEESHACGPANGAWDEATPGPAWIGNLSSN